MKIECGTACRNSKYNQGFTCCWECENKKECEIFCSATNIDCRHSQKEFGEK